MIKRREKEALFIEIHRAIEDAASRTAAALRTGGVDLSYPPNAGFSPAEQSALESLNVTPDLESAFIKIIADAASSSLFRLFCLLDGVGDPEGYDGVWLGLSLSQPSEDEEQGDMLHDDLFESYWKWRVVRPDPGWKLDVYES